MQIDDDRAVAIRVPEEFQEALENEWNLDWRAARKLMRIAGGGTVSEEGVKQYRLPIRTIAFIPVAGVMTPYVTADGYRWAFRMDSRRSKFIETNILQFPNDDNGNICITKARVGFHDGGVYEAHGAASNEKKGRSGFALEDVILLSETKSVRRAILNAVGLGFPVFEDAIDIMQRGLAAGSKNDVRLIDVSTTTVLPSAENPYPPNMVEVVKRATLELNMSMDDIKKRLDTEQPFSYADVNKAWDILNTVEGVVNAESSSEAAATV
jgi:hypothetical protein